MPGKIRRKHKYSAPISGLATVVVVAVGLVTIVVGMIVLTGRILDNSGDKKKIEATILPVVMFDPPPFELATDIDSIQILYYCLWSAILQNRDAYSLDENQELVVPAIDLDVAAANLFGEGIELQHQGFGDYELYYYYNADTHIYNVPTTAHLYVYMPQVESIERDGENYLVRVGYVPPSGITINYKPDAAAPDPDKYMIYVMKRVGGDYQIIAVRDDTTAIRIAT